MLSQSDVDEFHRLKLKFVSKDQIREVIDLWDSSLEFQHSQFKQFPDSNPFFKYLENNRSKLPLRSILSSVKFHYDAFAIKESPYLDLEFWDSHVGYYGTCFSHYPRECSRFHFFSGNEEAGKRLIEELENGRDESVLSELKIGYHGYCVLRPIPSFVVGRTAIEFDENSPEKLSSLARERLLAYEKNSRPFLKAKQERKITLLNALLPISAPEFIQQDPHLGHCGTASLWVSTNIASSKYGTSHFRFPTITRHAVGKAFPSQHTNLLYNPLDPNTGLSVLEIKNALSAAGGSYQEVSPGEGESPLAASMRIKNFIYSYVEYGLPVIIGLKRFDDRDGHVVATVGHSLPELKAGHQFNSLQIATNNAKHAHHFLVSDVIDLYYAHDDCYGPYNRIRFLNLAQDSTKQINAQDLTGIKFWIKPVVNFFNGPSSSATSQSKDNEPTENIVGSTVVLGKNEIQHQVMTAIAPVHLRIRNHAWNSLLLSIDKIQDKFSGYLPAGHVFLWRSFLISGSEFKRSLRNRGFGDVVKAFYAKLHLPKYMWVHEYTIVPEGKLHECFSSKIIRQIEGEFLFDATSPSYDVRFLSGRLRGACWDVGPSKFEVDKKTGLTDCINNINF